MGLNQSIANAESGNQDYYPNGQPVVSPKGAMYGMQVMPNTATDPGFGVTPAQDNSPAEYDRVGRDYIQALHQHYGDLPTAIAAYNWGPGNVDKYGAHNAPPETQSYVQKVMSGLGNMMVPSANAAETAPNSDPIQPQQMANLQTIRKQYPQYSDMSDQQLADAFHDKYYSDIPKDQFYQKIGVSAQPQTSAYESFSDKAKNMATFGMGSVANGLGAAAANIVKSPFTGNFNPSDAYTQGRAEFFNKSAQESQEHPTASLAGNIFGGLGSATVFPKEIEAASPAIMDRASAFLQSHTLPGATAGGIYGFGSTPGNVEDQLKGAGRQALEWGAVNSAIPAGLAALKGAAGGIGTIAEGVKSNVGDMDAVKAVSDPFYDEASKLYGKVNDKLNQTAADQLAANVDSAIAKNRFIPGLNPKTAAIVDDLKQAAQSGGLTVSDVDQYRRLLGRVGGSEDGFSAGQVKSAIDDTLNGLQGTDLQSGNISSISALNQARASYAKGARIEAITDILAKANGDPNKMTAGLQRFVANNDLKKMGFNAIEQTALNRAANLGVTENFLKAFGKFGFDFSKSGAGNTIVPGLIGATAKGSAAAFIPHAAPVVAGGTVARQAQKYMARGKSQQLLDVLKSREIAIPKTQIPEPPISGLLTYQPRPFLTDPQGVTSVPSNSQINDTLFGEGERTPYYPGERSNVNNRANDSYDVLNKYGGQKSVMAQTRIKNSPTNINPDALMELIRTRYQNRVK